MTEREPTPEDLDKLVTLLRRALKRLNTVEGRLSSIEERLHWLDDLPEQVQSLERMARRINTAEKMDKQAVRQVARDAAVKALKERGRA